MDNVQKQRESIVLYKEIRNGQDYIGIDYANSQVIALALSQDTEIEMDGNGRAYVSASTFRLPVFYERYSSYAYIITGYIFGIRNLNVNIYYLKVIWNCWNRNGTVLLP